MPRIPCRCLRFTALAAPLLLAAGCQLTAPHDNAPVAAIDASRDQVPPRIVVTPPRQDRRARPVIVLESVPERPDDLVAALRRDFRLPRSDDSSVTRELAWFASHPEYIERVFDRARRYLHHIAGELERRQMPADLALLPIVESAFDPFAYSHGRASGLWQIIPGTGRGLGLKQNWWFDGRRDVIESTRAALDYLEALHKQFDGDWLLAVAGYNSGEGNVARALRRAEAAGRPMDFWGIRNDLPFETRTYVPRLIAIRDLVQAPMLHGITLPEIPNEPFFIEVETGTQIDLALAADLSEVALDELYALNPGVNRWATDPDGPHRLLLPKDRADSFAAALAELGERDRVQWTRHRVAQGETLSELALEYRTTPAVLREVNHLRGNMIVAGDFLMIPHATTAMAAYGQSVESRTARQQNRSRDGERVNHTVRSGESLWSIASRYDVGVRELAAWNAMAPGDVLSTGRQLVVWTDGAAATAAAALAPDQVRRVNYVVRRGDSLSSIAGRFRVSVGQILEWNNLSVERYLQPGQRLVMYVDVTEQSS